MLSCFRYNDHCTFMKSEHDRIQRFIKDATPTLNFCDSVGTGQILAKKIVFNRTSEEIKACNEIKSLRSLDFKPITYHNFLFWLIDVITGRYSHVKLKNAELFKTVEKISKVYSEIFPGVVPNAPACASPFEFKEKTEERVGFTQRVSTFFQKFFYRIRTLSAGTHRRSKADLVVEISQVFSAMLKNSTIKESFDSEAAGLITSLSKYTFLEHFVRGKTIRAVGKVFASFLSHLADPERTQFSNAALARKQIADAFCLVRDYVTTDKERQQDLELVLAAKTRFGKMTAARKIAKEQVKGINAYFDRLITRLTEGQTVLIPSVYHATKSFFELILTDGSIKQSNDGASGPGIYASTNQENGYGNYAFALDARIAKLFKAQFFPCVNFPERNNIKSAFPSVYFCFKVTRIPVNVHTTAHLVVPDHENASEREGIPVLHQTQSDLVHLCFEQARAQFKNVFPVNWQRNPRPERDYEPNVPLPDNVEQEKSD